MTIGVGIGLSTSTATAESTLVPALVLGQQGIPRPGRRVCPNTTQDHAGHEILAGLQLAADQLGVGAVGDPEAQVDGLELFLVAQVDPGAAWRLDGRDGPEQRVDGLARLRRAVLRLGGERLLRDGGLLECADILPARPHPLDELLLLVGRHGLEPFQHLRLPLRIVSAAASSTTSGAARSLVALIAARESAPTIVLSAAFEPAICGGSPGRAGRG